MKLKLFVTISFLFFLASCGGYPIAQSSGKEDVGFLMFIKPQGHKKVNVTIDGKTHFQAKSVRQKQMYRKGMQYSVKTGRRKIKVTSSEGNLIYEKEIFVSPQEIKQILLP